MARQTDDHLETLREQSFLSERELAARWKLSCRTLQRWRAERFGPAYVMIGGSIRYGLDDVVAYEARMRRGGRA